MTLSESLAEHVVRADYARIAPDQLTEMSRLLVDYVGVTLGGSTTQTGRILQRFALSDAGTAEATLLGTGGRQVPAAAAAFANAVSAHSIELDDVDELALFHYGPPVMSAALAVGQRQNATGAQVLEAALAGCEVMARLSNAMNPSLRDRGFHTTPVVGAFGAAAVAGRLLGLSPTEMTSAFGLAGTQASGLMEMYGPSMQKRFNTGPAARNGVTAAVLAWMGFTGATSIIDGERGILAAFADRSVPSAVTDGLGDRVPVTIEYKPYSCARPIHNAIDAMLDIRAKGLHAGDVSAIHVDRHPDWSAYHLNTSPTTFHEAQVSLPYSVAVALVDGQALPPQYADGRLEDPQLRRLARLVTVADDPDLPRGVSCRVTVTTTSGATYLSQVDYPRGSVQVPLTEDDLVAKFMTLTAELIPGEDRARLARAVLAVRELGSICELVDEIEGACAVRQASL